MATVKDTVVWGDTSTQASVFKERVSQKQPMMRLDTQKGSSADWKLVMAGAMWANTQDTRVRPVMVLLVMILGYLVGRWGEIYQQKSKHKPN